MPSLLKTFLTALLVIPALDFFWLGLIASRFYSSRLESVGRISEGTIKPIYWAATIAYLLLALGISLFVTPYLQQTDAWWRALGYGALFGCIVYGVYDFTNLATLKAWPLSLLFADIAWGGVVCGIASLVAFSIRS